MYDTVLVATDGSGSANRAVTHALEQAEQHRATLHAIHVVDTDHYSEPALSSIELETADVEDWGTHSSTKSRAGDPSVSTWSPIAVTGSRTRKSSATLTR